MNQKIFFNLRGLGIGDWGLGIGIYLMSRGIDRDRARQLVVRGFFADVVGRIPSASWRAQVMERIEQRLGLEPEVAEADD